MATPKAKKRAASLEKLQHEFVFTTPNKFAPVTRNQIHGANYLLAQLDPYIALIKQFNPAADRSRFCLGILLHGTAGSGKTYLTRYVATETDARIINARNFPREESKEPWTRFDIMMLFGLLKKYVSERKKPIILFWDQFDEFVENAEEEETEVMSQLYTELDGLEGSAAGIVIIGATTKGPSEFDEQLMRPGRISIHIHFELPTKTGRAKILRFYLSQKPHANFDAESLAELLDDEVTPAAIKQLVEFAYGKAELRLRRSPQISKQDLLDAIVEKIMGHPGAAEEEKTPEIRLKIAIHEIGHALVAYILGRTVILVSTISSKGNHGITFWSHSTNDPADDFFITLAKISGNIAVAHGGLVADNIAGYPKDTGGYTDCTTGTNTAYNLVQQLTAGRKILECYGLLSFGSGSREKSQKLLLTIESDLANFLKKAEALAVKILKKVGRRKIVRLAKVLCKEKVLLREEVEKLFQKHGIKKR